MNIAAIWIIVAIFYFSLWFFDSFFKSCMHYPYYAFLNGTGLKIGILNFSWNTTVFNRLIFKWSHRCKRFLETWFDIGTVVTVITLPIAVILIISSGMKSYHSDTDDQPALQTTIPGVNMPVNDIVYYITALLLSTVTHELGHALAAVREDVSLISVGFYVFLIVPMAYVELSSEQLSSANIRQRLRVYCAGVWHNIVCGIVAYLLLVSSPYLFKAGYKTGHGLLVTQLQPHSPLFGDKGLKEHDIIISMNGCKVSDIGDWTRCINNVFVQPVGYCVNGDFVSNHDEAVNEIYKEDEIIDCCPTKSNGKLCFEYMEPKHGFGSLRQYSCLPPRTMIEGNDYKLCHEADDYACPSEFHCVKPLLNNLTRLMVITRLEHPEVIYIGGPNDLFTATVSNYIPRHGSCSVWIPDAFEKLMTYIVMFSMGLGFINVIPCYWFDGQHIMRNLILVFSRYFQHENHFAQSLSFCITFIGTLITIPILILSFAKVLYNPFA